MNNFIGFFSPRFQGQASATALSNPENLKEVVLLLEITSFQYMFDVLMLGLMGENSEKKGST